MLRYLQKLHELLRPFYGSSALMAALTASAIFFDDSTIPIVILFSVGMTEVGSYVRYDVLLTPLLYFPMLLSLLSAIVFSGRISPISLLLMFSAYTNITMGAALGKLIYRNQKTASVKNRLARVSLAFAAAVGSVLLYSLYTPDPSKNPFVSRSLQLSLELFSRIYVSDAALRALDQPQGKSLRKLFLSFISALFDPFSRQTEYFASVLLATMLSVPTLVGKTTSAFDLLTRFIP